MPAKRIQDNFLAVPNTILFAKGLVVNSQNIPLSLNDKILWCYMYQRFEYFTKISNTFYHDSDLQLSLKLNINKRRVMDFISKLEELQLLHRLPMNPYNPRSQKYYTKISDPLSCKFY